MISISIYRSHILLLLLFCISSSLVILPFFDLLDIRSDFLKSVYNANGRLSRMLYRILESVYCVNGQLFRISF